MAFMQNPMSQDPMQALEAAMMRAEGPGAQMPPGGAPAPAPMPIAPPAQAAPLNGEIIPPSAPASPGGGIGFGDRIGNALAGRGFFGDGKSDETIDPSTGVPRGLMRESNMQGIMKVGLMLIAAGQRQSDDSRAAVMAKIPSLMDNSDQINNFANTRLKLAQMKLAERQQLQQEQLEKASQSAITAAMGGGSSAPAPAPVSPGMQAVQATMGTGGSDQAATPVAGNPETPSPGSPAPASAAPSRVPSPPVAPPLSPTDAAMLRGMTPQARMDFLLKRNQSFQDQEVPGGVYVDPDTGRKARDFYKNGRLVRTENLGETQGTADTVTIDGQKFVRKLDARGKQIGLQPIAETPDPGAAAMANDYVKMNSAVREGAGKGRAMMKLVSDIEQAAENPSVYFGTGGKKVLELRKALGSIGLTGLDGVAEGELATKATNQLALKMRDPDGEFGGLPGATSNRDLSFLLDSVPGLNSTRGGAKLVARSFKKIGEMQVEADKLRLNYLKKNGKLDTGFEVELNDFYENKKLLDDNERKEIIEALQGPKVDTGGGDKTRKTSNGTSWSVN